MMTSIQRKPSRAIETLLPGQVSYLKKRAECSEEDILRANMNDGCFGHLVLILSTDTRKAQVEAFILTSFGGRSIEEKHPHNRRIRLYHLPIAPAPRHPDNGILLELDGNLRLPKKTYIKTESPHTIPWSMLRPHYCDLQSRKLLELEPHSFAQLLQYVNAGVSAEPERFPKIFNPIPGDYQDHDDVQGQDTPEPETVLQLTLVGCVAYLRSLFNKALHFVV